MRIKNCRIRSCAILQRFRWDFCFLVAKFFWFTLEKRTFFFFFLRVNRKIWQLKTEITIRILRQFCFLSCGGFQIKQSLIFLLLIENVGSYNSLLLHCAPPPHVSYVMCHMVHVRCQLSGVKCPFIVTN